MVATLDGDWPPEQWGIKLNAGHLPMTLKPGQCVRYHQSLPGYAQEGRDLPLKDGETYGFAMRRMHSEGHWADGLYLSVFCLERGADGKRHVRPYIQHEDESTTYPTCGRYIGWKPAPDGIMPPGYSPPVD